MIMGLGFRAVISAAAAITLALALAGPAQAENIGAVTGDELEAALADAGLNPTIVEDAATGAPVAYGKAGETSFFVRAMSCSGSPVSCEELIFFANFPLGAAPTAKDYRIVNNFNDSSVFGRGFILENSNEVGVDYVIELGGGVSKEHLAQNIARWADVIAAFVATFQEGVPES